LRFLDISSQILTHADHFLAKMEAFVTTLEQGGTDATAKLDILELTVKQVSVIEQHLSCAKNKKPSHKLYNRKP